MPVSCINSNLPSTGGGIPLPNHSLATAYKQLCYYQVITHQHRSPHLVSVESPDGSAGHPLSPVLRSVVIMNDDGVANDGRVSAQRKVGVGEELLGGAEVYDLAGHLEVAELGGQVSNPASLRCLVLLTILIHAEIITKL